MKRIQLLSFFQCGLIIFFVITIEITTAEQPSNSISSPNTSIHLSHWQIIKDTEPKLSLPILPDSLWQSFEPAPGDDRYEENNWVIRTIVEDERPIAEDIKYLTGEILQKDITSIHIEVTLATL